MCGYDWILFSCMQSLIRIVPGWPFRTDLAQDK